MKRLREMWDFLTKFPALHRAIVSEFDSHNDQVAELQRQLAEARAARRHAQSVSSELVKEKRELEAQLAQRFDQLPEGMEECTILFKECEKGHGRLTATNWLDHGCQTCAIASIQAAETVESVTLWANQSFGHATIRAQVERAMSEVSELALAVLTGTDEKIAEEAADVCICLYRVMGTLDRDAINKKMARNRVRKWNVAANGCAQHVSEG
ncbi:MAG: hypothetical protein HQL97_00315 [Magnetococcales bacterium]|nr:hypothetical protein [Magnetococcales bacterium]